MQEKKILVIGSLNMDMAVNVPYIPAVGETILGGDIMETPGGKGANQAYAAGMLGGRVTMLGAVGNDESGKRMLESLGKANVDLSNILVEKSVRTGTAVILVNKNGNNSIVVAPGANNFCDVAYLRTMQEKISDCDILLLQLEIPREAAYFAIEMANALGKTVILNPAPAPDRIPSIILSKIDYITPNESELRKLTGLPVNTHEEVRAACEVLLEQGVKSVLVTLGGDGALLASRGEFFYYPVKDVEVVDTTAAGDTFNAAVAVMLAEGKGMDNAVAFANQAATITVQRKGAQASIPSREEVEQEGGF